MESDGLDACRADLDGCVEWDVEVLEPEPEAGDGPAMEMGMASSYDVVAEVDLAGSSGGVEETS